MTVLALSQGAFAFLGVLFVAFCGVIYGHFTQRGIGPHPSDGRSQTGCPDALINDQGEIGAVDTHRAD